MRNVQKLLAGPGVLGAALLGLSGPAWGQATAATDSAATAAALAATYRVYAAARGTESLLYNGPEYVEYTKPGTRGHQFWESAEPQTGAVDYRGGHFAGVPLRYDIARDQLVLLYPGQAVGVILADNQVNGFALGARRFVRVAGDTLNKEALAGGFYQLLADGPVRLLARHHKKVDQTTIGQVLTFEYRQTDELFAQDATRAVEVTSLRRLLSVLPAAHQAEVQRYARQQQLKFSSGERAESATRLMNYYYTLRP